MANFSFSDVFEVVATHTMHLILAAFVVSAIIILIKIQRAPDRFDLRATISDEKGNPSIHKIGQLTALVLSTWILVYTTIHGALSETMFGTYMGIWAAAQAADKWLSRSNPNGPPPPNPPPPQ